MLKSKKVQWDKSPLHFFKTCGHTLSFLNRNEAQEKVVSTLDLYWCRHSCLLLCAVKKGGHYYFDVNDGSANFILHQYITSLLKDEICLVTGDWNGIFV